MSTRPPSGLGELLDGVHATRHDPASLAAIKGSISMLPILERAVRTAPPGAPTSFRLTIKAMGFTSTGGPWTGCAPRARPEQSGQRRSAAERAARARATALLEAAWERLPRELRDRRRTERAHFDRELRDRTEFDLFIEERAAVP